MHHYSLQNKLVAVFLVLGLVFSLGSYAGLKALVYPVFTDFEQRAIESSVARLELAIDAELAALEAFNREYTNWDHSYDFVQGQRDVYVTENLDTAYWDDVNISMMLYFDAANELLWGAVIDPASGEQRDLTAELAAPIGPNHLLLRNDARHVSSGIISTRSGPMLVSSLPILKTLGEGPAAGTLIAGRLLTPKFIEALGRRAGVVAQLHTTEAENPVQRQAFELTGDYVSSHYALIDIWGTSAYDIDVRIPQTFLGIAETTFNTTLAFEIFATVLFLVAGWLFIRNRIITPIDRLKQHILHIRETGDLDQPLDTFANDEIGLLAREFGQLAKGLGQAQRELESARDQALAISDAKSEFLARMSHEIRTPLNGVLGMLELLQSTPLSREQQRYAQAVRESGETLLQIVNDVLDFAKLEANKLELDVQRFNLNGFLTDLTDNLSPLAASKGLTLSCIAPEGEPLIVEGDTLRLRQVLTNLVSNAIKFTEKGSVVLEVTASGEQDDRVSLRFAIIDTGIGIAPRRQRVIFNSFAQEDGSTTRRFGGTGLGLSISKELVALMGGDIALQSQPGKGSTFSFELEFKACNAGEVSDSVVFLRPDSLTPRAEEQTIGRLRGRVLVAEDNAINLAMMADMLTNMGVEHDIARNGEEAIERYTDNNYDAILMDCEMPRVDGYQASARIRDIEQTGQQQPVRIIAVTAHALAGDMEKCVAAGMDDYLRKPYTGEQLFDVLAKVLPGGEQAGDETPPEHSGAEQQDDADSAALDVDALDALAELPQAADKDIEIRVIGAYLEKSKELMSKLASAMDACDAEFLRATALALQSASASIGATGLAGLAVELSRSTRKSDHAIALELLRQIQDEYGRVVRALGLRLREAAA